ncbi:hypothetical protein [Tetragenococcus halophilus]|uniref:Uncharacterized protein n=1 Tax=Tetragenococcus halophilus TaxID=51669 RepID=A0AB35HLV9_TETHA|nr:hypothetical protein [Tetragenococcus halophilus]MCO8297248.1 hypothetical protein [Tetragenococcus halophilus]
MNNDDNQFFEQIRKDLQSNMDGETRHQVKKATERYWAIYEEAQKVGFNEDQAFDILLTILGANING